MRSTAPLLFAAVLGTSLTAAGPAAGAGGHFDVDDAAIADVDHCQVETWWMRAPRTGATLGHLGPACRLGPVEAGVDLERTIVADDRLTSLGPHVKWATSLVPDRLAAGLYLGGALDLTHGGWLGSAYVPVSWTVAPGWTVHANLGRDRGPAGVATRRGLSLEIAPNERWLVIGEHARIAGGAVSRLGARRALGAGFSLDASVARVRSVPGALFAVGLNVDIDR